MRDNAVTTGDWQRIPSRGYLQGLSRSYIFGLIKAGKIKTANIVQPGCVKGVRLLYMPSLTAFIERHIDEPRKAG